MSPVGCQFPFALLVSVLVLSGCGRGAGGQRSSSSVAASAAPGLAQGSLPARDTIPFDESQWVKPALRYGSFRAAAESLRAIVTRSLGAYADSAIWQRSSIAFDYRDSVQMFPSGSGTPMWVLGSRPSPPVTGLTMSLAVRSSDGFDAENVVLSGLRGAGWMEDGQYAADGTDGSTLALVCQEAICRYEASWDAGDDSDSTYVPKPGMSVRLQCVPRSTVRGLLAKSR